MKFVWAVGMWGEFRKGERLFNSLGGGKRYWHVALAKLRHNLKANATAGHGTLRDNNKTSKFSGAIGIGTVQSDPFRTTTCRVAGILNIMT